MSQKSKFEPGDVAYWPEIDQIAIIENPITGTAVYGVAYSRYNEWRYYICGKIRSRNLVLISKGEFKDEMKQES